MNSGLEALIFVLVLLGLVIFIIISRSRVKLKLEKQQAQQLADRHKNIERSFRERETGESVYVVNAFEPYINKLFGKDSVKVMQLIREHATNKTDVEQFRIKYLALNLSFDVPADQVIITLLKGVKRLKHFYVASSSGIKYFEHVGLQRTTDPELCKSRYGKTFSLAEIDKMDTPGLGPSKIFGCGWGTSCHWEADPFK